MAETDDSAKRGEAAEQAVRSRLAVTLDPAKPPAERTLPGDLLRRLAKAENTVVIRNAVFDAPCNVDNVTFEQALILENCTFGSFSAVSATFELPITLKNCTFGSCSFRLADVSEAIMTGIEVADTCAFDYADVSGQLDFSGGTIATLILAGARVEGDLSAMGLTVTTLYAQGLSVRGTLFAIGAHFLQQPTFDDVEVSGAALLTRATFDAFFRFARGKAVGTFSLNAATLKGGLGVEGLTCATLSMAGATIQGDTSFYDLDARNVLLRGSAFHGLLLVERGAVHGVFDVRDIAVDGDLVMERVDLAAINVAGVRAASLIFTDLECDDLYADYAGGAGVPEAAGTSEFRYVSMIRSNVRSLRPYRWVVPEELRVASGTLGYCLIEENRLGGLRFTDTKIGAGCFVGKNEIAHDVVLLNAAVDGPTVLKENAIGGAISITLCAMNRLDLARQTLPANVACTSSKIAQLRFDEHTERHAPGAAERYRDRLIDLDSSSYDDVSCSVAGLLSALARRPSRQQFIVLERALRNAGFDELGDTVYQAGRTWYYKHVTRELSVRLRGWIADWTTGFGVSVMKITAVAVAIPVLAFLMLVVSPGSVADSGTPATCAAAPAPGAVALVVGQTFVGAGDAKVELTGCPVLHAVPARAVQLPLRILGMIVFSLWIVIATGILKYAVKSGT